MRHANDNREKSLSFSINFCVDKNQFLLAKIAYCEQNKNILEQLLNDLHSPNHSYSLTMRWIIRKKLKTKASIHYAKLGKKQPYYRRCLDCI